MANEIKFIDYSSKVKEALSTRSEAVLEECAGELESQVKRNTRVRTGKTKNSWQHTVNKNGEVTEAHVGSNYENTIWEEFGTGDYALQGNGRKGGWYYEDEKGEGHFTHGKKPSRAFWNTYNSLKNSIIKQIQNSFKGL